MDRSEGRRALADYVELRLGRSARMVTLERDRVTIGRSSTNDIALPEDGQVSRTHAVLERLPTGWYVTDFSSANGTFVNGRRIWGECPLRSGDELRMGEATLVFRSDAPARDESTVSGQGVPELTRRERDVLVALCTTALSGDIFTEPASIRDIAGKLFVSEAAVKQHLLRLYDKFGIFGEGERRRLRLANEAIRRGAITRADLGGRRSSGEET
jgi:hypothetical protein